MNDNIIPFPRDFNINADPVTKEQKDAMISSLRQEMSDEITDDLVQMIINLYHNYGLYVTPENINIKDCIFMEEVIRASVYRYKGIPHFLHEMIDDIVTLPDEIEDDDEDGDGDGDGDENELFETDNENGC